MAGFAGRNHPSGWRFVSMPNAIAIWWIVSRDGRFWNVFCRGAWFMLGSTDFQERARTPIIRAASSADQRKGHEKPRS
jgi:hypothetical protein